MAASGRLVNFATAVTPVFRHSSPSVISSSRLCIRCLRAQSGRPLSVAASRSNARRNLATEAVQYRPHSLDSQPPPRNAGIPETSIAGGKHTIDEAPKMKPTLTRDENSGSGISEAEAQKPKSSFKTGGLGSVAAPEPAPSKPQRKSKLRPRKAAMKLTPAAVEALKELLDQPEPKLIRVGVKNRGCSGLAYHLEYVDRAGSFDEAVDQDGVKVLVDSKALFSIIGSEMDWVEDKLSRRFVFKNPNITDQCGCGESFSIS